MLALIPLFPFLGFLVNATMGRRLPKAVSGGLASLAMIGSFLVAAMSVYQLTGMAPAERAIEQTVYTWMTSGDFTLDLTFRVDPLSAVMILVITGIGSLIHIYSTAYMHDETQAHLRALAPDVMVVVAYGLILPQAVLDIPRYGALNIHASLLPRWRGAAPIQDAGPDRAPGAGARFRQRGGLSRPPRPRRSGAP